MFKIAVKKIKKAIYIRVKNFTKIKQKLCTVR